MSWAEREKEAFRRRIGVSPDAFNSAEVSWLGPTWRCQKKKVCRANGSLSDLCVNSAALRLKPTNMDDAQVTEEQGTNPWGSPAANLEGEVLRTCPSCSAPFSSSTQRSASAPSNLEQLSACCGSMGPSCPTTLKPSACQATWDRLAGGRIMARCRPGPGYDGLAVGTQTATHLPLKLVWC